MRNFDIPVLAHLLLTLLLLLQELAFARDVAAILAVTSFLKALTVSRAMTRPPMAAWIAILKSWRADLSLRNGPSESPSVRMPVISESGGCNKRVVAEPRVFYEVSPLYDLNYTSELAAQILDPATSVQCCAPTICMYFKLTDDVGHYIAVKNTIIRDSNSRISKIFYLTLL